MDAKPELRSQNHDDRENPGIRAVNLETRRQNWKARTMTAGTGKRELWTLNREREPRQRGTAKPESWPQEPRSQNRGARTAEPEPRSQNRGCGNRETRIMSPET